MKELFIFSAWLQADSDSAKLWDTMIKEQQGKDLTNLPIEQKVAIRLAQYIYRTMKGWLELYGY